MSDTGYGYYAFPGSPSYSGYSRSQYPERRSLQGLIIALTALLSVMAVLCVVNAAALFSRAGQFANAAAGGFVSEEEAAGVDLAVLVTSVLIQLLAFAIAVVFIVWQYRHAKNARVLSESGLGPGWAIGGWFIPAANAVLPSIQLYHSSRASAMYPNPQRSTLMVIVPWAISFYGGNMLAGGAVGIWPDTVETTAELQAARDSDVVEGVSSLLWLVAAVLCIAMVRWLSRRQDRALDEVFARLPTQPAPTQPGAVPPGVGPQQPWTRHQPRHPTGQEGPWPAPPASPGTPDDPWRTPS